MSLRPISGAEEFDRRMRSLGQAPAPHGDALAELARLVGHQDPFRERFAEEPASAVDLAAFDAELRKPSEEELHSVPRHDPAIVRSPLDAAVWDGAPVRYPTISVRDPQHHEPSPDAWAEGTPDPLDEGHVAPPHAPAEAGPPERGGAKRTLIVLAAVVVLTGGGLAASFLTRPSGGAMSATAVTPTILAASGPSKVQPDTGPSGADAPSQPSTLLDKNNNDGTAAAKVVNTIEQPVDLAQAVRPAPAPAADPATDAAPAAAPGAFPEPRRVKTVLVRPDGSIIADAPAAPADAVGSTASDETSLAFDPKTSLPPTPSVAPGVVDPSAAVPVVPPKPAKTTARATPKAAASTTQNASALAQARTTVATPKAKPIVHAQAKPAAAPAPKPAVEVAAAAPDAATPDAAAPAAATPLSGAGGTFAIQLGAAPSEAEAHDAARKIAQKYALGGAPVVIKAEAGGKTVYRIRLGHLSADDAKAMCAKVQADGGGCFIAHK